MIVTIAHLDEFPSKIKHNDHDFKMTFGLQKIFSL